MGERFGDIGPEMNSKGKSSGDGRKEVDDDDDESAGYRAWRGINKYHVRGIAHAMEKNDGTERVAHPRSPPSPQGFLVGSTSLWGSCLVHAPGLLIVGEDICNLFLKEDVVKFRGGTLWPEWHKDRTSRRRSWL